MAQQQQMAVDGDGVAPAPAFVADGSAPSATAAAATAAASDVPMMQAAPTAAVALPASSSSTSCPSSPAAADPSAVLGTWTEEHTQTHCRIFVQARQSCSFPGSHCTRLLHSLPVVVFEHVVQKVFLDDSLARP